MSQNISTNSYQDLKLEVGCILIQFNLHIFNSLVRDAIKYILTRISHGIGLRL
jgi:hypothetical protein